MKSKQVDCILKKLRVKSAEKNCMRCEKWQNDNREVVMLSRLLKYIEEHVSTHGFEIGEIITPKLSMINCSSYDEIVAFRTRITMDISCKYPGRPKTKQINILDRTSCVPVFPEEPIQKEFLFNEFSGNFDDLF